jgi:hypothetical protein
MMVEGQRPQPRRIYRGCRLRDPADGDAIGEHVEIIVVPPGRVGRLAIGSDYRATGCGLSARAP